MQSLGWHQCAVDTDALADDDADGTPLRWRAGTLYRGRLDAQSTLWELAKRGVTDFSCFDEGGMTVDERMAQRGAQDIDPAVAAKAR